MLENFNQSFKTSSGSIFLLKNQAKYSELYKQINQEII